MNLLSFASVMQTVGSVLVAILVLLAMITVHELGHYVVGKILKFDIKESLLSTLTPMVKKMKVILCFDTSKIMSARLFKVWK